MSGLPGYDAWKLATPPEYEQSDTCPKCGEQFGAEPYCEICGWSAEEADEDAYWRHVNAKIDAARGK